VSKKKIHKPTGLVAPDGTPVSTLGELPQEDQPEALAALEKADERTIAEELAGLSDLAKFMVYVIKFKTKNKDPKTGKTIYKPVFGLSINGVRSLGKKFCPGGFDPQPLVPGAPIFVDVDYELMFGNTKKMVRYCRAGVKMVNKKTGEATMGIAHQEMMAVRYSNEDVRYEVFDIHYVQKALTKAQRKGIEDQIEPEKRFRYLYRWLAEREKVLQIDHEREEQQKAITYKAPVTGKDTMRNRVFAICGQAGMDTNAEAGTIKAFVARAWQKPFGDLTQDEYQKAGDQMETQIAKAGKEAFCKALRGEE
jgi:hypothetical protein